ncbi:uncharacterized protein LOC126906793 isoform X3 [Daktulosphaira vitifoliae]|uniref:uncharacterized protein LOC126906793 isoform X2 n=1 Tax=Daktulosphaira vitifoliae TaxID=58002 RepID=UPI0021AA6154|nr:uncharacterized protein LOC126906793 isoform X2 [Daktulosphaira vitifoliae]XP_050543614.1 uncharacterized protein LOC126906793 isoform X3 [Daktulosphaira vitifoliae]
MFSIKLSEICVLLLYTIVLIKAYNNTERNTAIINTFCDNNWWKQISILQSVKCGSKYYHLSEINKIVNREQGNGKVRGAALFLGCLYAIDLLEIFYMINFYQNKCEIVLLQNHNPYECTINLLRIIKKLTLLATVIKESLIALDALYNMRPNTTKIDYILYNYLTRLQKVERNIFHKLPLQDNPKSCEIILKNVGLIFNAMKEDIKHEIQDKTIICFFKPEIFEPMVQNWETVYKIQNNEENFFFFNDLYTKIDNEIRMIVIEKCYNLGFYFNTEIMMIDVSVPQEVLDQYPKKSIQPYILQFMGKVEPKESDISKFIEKEKGKKSATEVAELLDFLEKALKDENLFDEEIKVTGLISDNSSGPSEPSNKKLKI